jgi:large subunit ribosomal protein L18e
MKTNLQTRKLIGELRKSKVALWKRIAEELETPTRYIVAVNINKIYKTLREGETALVPGKVLSVGRLTKKSTISALGFSEIAKAKIEQDGGHAISILDLFKKNPKGNNVRIIK